MKNNSLRMNLKNLENKNCNLLIQKKRINNFIKWILKKIIRNKIIIKMSQNKSSHLKFRSKMILMMKKKIRKMKWWYFKMLLKNKMKNLNIKILLNVKIDKIIMFNKMNLSKLLSLNNSLILLINRFQNHNNSNNKVKTLNLK